MTSYLAWISCTLAIVAAGVAYVIWNARTTARAMAALAADVGARQVRRDPASWEGTLGGRTVRMGFAVVPRHMSCSPGWNTVADVATMLGGVAATVQGRPSLLLDAAEAADTATLRQLILEVPCRNPALIDVRKLAGGLESDANVGRLDGPSLERLLAARVGAHQCLEIQVDAVRFRMDLGYLGTVREPWLRGWLHHCAELAAAVERAGRR